jgi:hypothetical protein
MFADLLPILCMFFHKFNQQAIIFLFPTLFGVILESPVAAVTHFGIPTFHLFCELGPI